ncbi:Protein NRT1/ PTR FAMILY 5.6 like [Actinidia chinensis var. chinensis]|uniref:Protein NRT1/ PTR FAMILY 5.6 like n=1 Tax=Actinidia chinensis var. chinensis TaxID=1590841 RepID=A0A2R6R8B7_ACTCC|nr:Protein NRT1/ PTR FAMILY 5.6 like [Actinidia chinensis var. chinensis]
MIFIVLTNGLILLTMSRLVPNLKPCDASSNCQEPRKIHEVVFFLAIYLISVGNGDHKPAVESFGADQFDDDHPKERIKKMSFFNWLNFGVAFGILLGLTVIVYVQDHVSWAVADIVLTAVMAGSVVVFCAGRPFYRYRKPMGSPLTPMLHVLVAAIRKRHLAYPSNPAEFYEVPKSKNNGRLLCHTHKLKFLDKAAILEDKQSSSNEKQQSPGRLATVTKVLLPILRKATGNERGITILQRIGIGMFFSVLTMLVAALVERKRLSLVAKNPLQDSTTMSVFWLAPQFLMIGIGEGFALVGLQEFFYDQVPESMRSLGIAFFLSVLGVGHFISSLLITIVDRVTNKMGKSWFEKDLNSSRLDNFYWVLAIISALNLGGYVVLARRYSYKNVRESGDGSETMA